MINWSRKKMWIAGLSVIVVTNAVALFGAAWNRSGTPESQLQLTQRELQVPYWRMNRESSGASLNLLWRTLPVEAKDSDYPGFRGDSGAPSWLDQTKLQSLGFDMAGLVARAQGHTRRELALSKSALVVLELNGPAYQAYLARVRRYTMEVEAKASAASDSADMKRRLESARNNEKRALDESSRLFAVDAGMDLSELRAKYPGRSRYAIVHAQIRPRVFIGKDGVKVEGSIDQISNRSVNIPHDYRAMFKGENGMQPYREGIRAKEIAVTIAFGKRLEPWVLALSASKSAGAGQ